MGERSEKEGSVGDRSEGEGSGGEVRLGGMGGSAEMDTADMT